MYTTDAHEYTHCYDFNLPFYKIDTQSYNLYNLLPSKSIYFNENSLNTVHTNTKAHKGLISYCTILEDSIELHF